MRYKPLICAKIINACVVIHNYLIKNEYNDVVNSNSAVEVPGHDFRGRDSHHENGLIVRQRVIDNLI